MLIVTVRKELNAAIKQENTDIEELTDLINSKDRGSCRLYIYIYIYIHIYK